MVKLRLIKNVKALSKLSLIILIIASLIVGALLSYLWVMGYYLTLGINIPEKTTLSINNVAFTNQDTRYFNASFFNPSYSPSAANITKIAVRTADKKLHDVTQTSPTMPYIIPKTQNITFKCMWNWANYTGQNVGVIAFIEDGSGPTREVTTPFVDLTITEVRFNSSISVTHFNLTIQNSPSSVTDIDVSQIIMPDGPLSSDKVSPSLPYKIGINKTQAFKCVWYWVIYQNKSVTISVNAVQGYTTSLNKTTSQQPLTVEATNLVFSELDTTHFNITVRNRKESPTFVNIIKIITVYENGTVYVINGTQITPDPLPYKLDINSNKTFKCPFDWTYYRGKIVSVYIHTTQDYTFGYTQVTPSPIEITNAIFNATDTNNFNVTVHNSPHYYTYVNIENITLTFENGTTREINGITISPQLPYTLSQGTYQSFRCPWDWINYQGRNITITVKTAENYTAQFVKVTPKRVILTITNISFDTINTGIFEVTVRNSALSVEDANITRVTVTFANGTVIEVSGVTPSLPYLLPHGSDSTVTFVCQWDWTNYRGKTITITIHAEKGYVAFSLYTTPPLQ